VRCCPVQPVEAMDGPGWMTMSISAGNQPSLSPPSQSGTPGQPSSKQRPPIPRVLPSFVRAHPGTRARTRPTTPSMQLTAACRGSRADVPCSPHSPPSPLSFPARRIAPVGACRHDFLLTDGPVPAAPPMQPYRGMRPPPRRRNRDRRRASRIGTTAPARRPPAACSSPLSLAAAAPDAPDPSRLTTTGCSPQAARWKRKSQTRPATVFHASLRTRPPGNLAHLAATRLGGAWAARPPGG